jgi:hypothetical protein
MRHDYEGRDVNNDPIYNHTTPYPTIKFNGTVKLHGANTAVQLHADGEMIVQTRESLLGEHGNNPDYKGFNAFVKSKNLLFEEIANFYPGAASEIVVYGEWCGSGVQDGVALVHLPKMFVVFALKIDGVYYNYKQDSEFLKLLESFNTAGIYHINQFPTYEIEVDFNNPEASQAEMDRLTLEVENECPVAKQLGVSGVGEGIVWSAFVTVADAIELYAFKTKGPKHAVSGKKSTASAKTEVVEGLDEFIEMAVTENRMRQMIERMEREGKTTIMPNMGIFINYVADDVFKEETDAMIESGLDAKQTRPAILNKAREWYKTQLK